MTSDDTLRAPKPVSAFHTWALLTVLTVSSTVVENDILAVLLAWAAIIILTVVFCMSRDPLFPYLTSLLALAHNFETESYAGFASLSMFGVPLFLLLLLSIVFVKTLSANTLSTNWRAWPWMLPLIALLYGLAVTYIFGSSLSQYALLRDMLDPVLLAIVLLVGSFCVQSRNNLQDNLKNFSYYFLLVGSFFFIQSLVITLLNEVPFVSNVPVAAYLLIPTGAMFLWEGNLSPAKNIALAFLGLSVLFPTSRNAIALYSVTVLLTVTWIIVNAIKARRFKFFLDMAITPTLGFILTISIVFIWVPDVFDIVTFKLLFFTNEIFSELSKSPAVRANEFMSILGNSDVYRLVFGNGLGAGVALENFYGLDFDRFDYAAAEIDSGMLVRPHTIVNYMLLKYGFLGLTALMAISAGYLWHEGRSHWPVVLSGSIIFVYMLFSSLSAYASAIVLMTMSAKIRRPL